MKDLIEGAGYRDLGILQTNQIRYTEMNENVKAKNIRRVHKVLVTKVNDANIIK